MPPFVRGLIATGLLFGAACSSKDPANSPGAAIATTSAVLIGGALSPVGRILSSTTGSGLERQLISPAVYDLGDGRIAIANRSGWFTDKSEFSPGQQGQSAWVIDLKTEPRDHRGVMVLANDNLQRWFFRDHDHTALRLILYEGPLKAVNTTTGDRVQQGSDRRTLTLLLGPGTHRFFLSQDPIETLQPPARP